MEPEKSTRSPRSMMALLSSNLTSSKLPFFVAVFRSCAVTGWTTAAAVIRATTKRTIIGMEIPNDRWESETPDAAGQCREIDEQGLTAHGHEINGSTHGRERHTAERKLRPSGR